MQNAEKPDNITKKELEDARKVLSMQSKLFKPEFNNLLQGLIKDITDSNSFDNELMQKVASILDKQNVGQCILILTYLLAIVTATDRFEKDLDIVKNELERKTEIYIS